MIYTDSTYRIYIVGHAACGKSTFGHLIAKQLRIPFIDLDRYIQKRFQASIEQIFLRGGEEGFRKVERAMLHEVSQRNRVVVACGGGTPCFHDNMDYMNSRGMTIWLQASEQSIAERMENSYTVRPMFAGLSGEELRDRIREIMTEREPFYSKAAWHLVNDDIHTAELAIDTAHKLMKNIRYSHT